MRRKRRGTLETLLEKLPKRDLKLLFKAADAFLASQEKLGITTVEITQKSGADTSGPAKPTSKGGCHG